MQHSMNKLFNIAQMKTVYQTLFQTNKKNSNLSLHKFNIQ